MNNSYRNGQVSAIDTAISGFIRIPSIKLWPDEIIEGLNSLKNIYLYPLPGVSTMKIAGIFVPVENDTCENYLSPMNEAIMAFEAPYIGMELETEFILRTLRSIRDKHKQ